MPIAVTNGMIHDAEDEPRIVEVNGGQKFAIVLRGGRPILITEWTTYPNGGTLNDSREGWVRVWEVGQYFTDSLIPVIAAAGFTLKDVPTEGETGMRFRVIPFMTERGAQPQEQMYALYEEHLVNGVVTKSTGQHLSAYTFNTLYEAVVKAGRG